MSGPTPNDHDQTQTTPPVPPPPPPSVRPVVDTITSSQPLGTEASSSPSPSSDGNESSQYHTPVKESLSFCGSLDGVPPWEYDVTMSSGGSAAAGAGDLRASSGSPLAEQHSPYAFQAWGNTHTTTDNVPFHTSDTGMGACLAPAGMNSNSPVPLNQWRRNGGHQGLSWKERIRHKLSKTSEFDCSQEFHDANIRLKHTRAKAESLYEASREFDRASQTFEKALRSFCGKICNMFDNIFEDVEDDEGKQELQSIKTNVQRSISAFNQFSRELTSTFIHPMDHHISPQLVKVKEVKQECYTKLYERNDLASKIKELAKSSRLGTGTNKLSDLQGKHRHIADKFSNLHQSSVYHMSKATNDIKRLFIGSFRSYMEQQLRYCTNIETSARGNLGLLDSLSAKYTFALDVYGENIGLQRVAQDMSNSRRTDATGTNHKRGENLINELESRGYVDDDVSLRASLGSSPGSCPTMFSEAVQNTLLPVLGIPLHGENVLLVVTRVCEQTSGQLGTLVATDYRLRFSPYIPVELGNMVPCGHTTEEIGLMATLSIPLRSISQMRSSFNKSTQSSSITLWCHNLRYVIFDFFHTEKADGRRPSIIKNQQWEMSGTHLSESTKNAKHVSLGASNVARILETDILDHVWMDDPHFNLNYRLPPLSEDLESSIRPLANIHTQYFSSDQIDKLQKSNRLESPSFRDFDGWKIHQWENEIDRLHEASSFFRVSSINEKFELSRTYPAFIIVPRPITDSTLEVAAKYRSKHRLPAVVWAFGPICLARAAQPMPGVWGSYSKEDEDLIAAFKPDRSWLDSRFGNDDSYRRRVLEQRPRIAMYDARPKMNAVSNKTKGGGSENKIRYSESSLVFLNIPNIHAVRNAFINFRAHIVSAGSQGLHESKGAEFEGRSRSASVATCTSRKARVKKLNEAVPEDGTNGTEYMDEECPLHDRRGTYSSTYFDLDPHVSSRVIENVDVYKAEWMRLVADLLTASYRLAKDICKGTSVFIHCSDGWDRTAELAGLVQLFLDPYYRSMAGFCALVDKEWCTFGHQFSRRSGTGCEHARKNHNDKQRSPVFLQFLDAVWQFTNQHPNAFEFNQKLLMFLAEHVYSGRFGNFMFDCISKRYENKLHEKSLTSWDFISRYPYVFRNPSYALPPKADETAYYQILADAFPCGGSENIHPEACFLAGSLVTKRLLQNESRPDAFALFPVAGGDIGSLHVWPYWFHRWIS